MEAARGVVGGDVRESGDRLKVHDAGCPGLASRDEEPKVRPPRAASSKTLRGISSDIPKRSCSSSEVIWALCGLSWTLARYFSTHRRRTVMKASRSSATWGQMPSMRQVESAEML